MHFPYKLKKGVKSLKAFLLCQARNDTRPSPPECKASEQEADRKVEDQTSEEIPITLLNQPRLELSTVEVIDRTVESQTSQEIAITLLDQPRLDTLPLEVLQDIMSHLSALDYMRTKFVCRAMYVVSKMSDGHDIRSKPGHSLWTSEKIYEELMWRNGYARAMAQIEASLVVGPRLTALTCSFCGHLKTISSHGFCDQEFQYAKVGRICLQCFKDHNWRRDEPVSVHGMPYFRCQECFRVGPETSRVTDNDLETMSGDGTLCRLLKDSWRDRMDPKVCLECFKAFALKYFRGAFYYADVDFHLN